jgi:class 3 adenylate cyclase
VRRSRPLDLALLLALGPLFALCVALHTARSLEGRIAWLPLQVAAAGPDGYPRVRGFAAGTRGGVPDLEIGDTLLRIGGRDLRGVGALGFTPAAWQELDADLSAELVWRRGVEERRGELVLAPARFPLRTLPLTLITGFVALLVLLRGRGSAAARAFFLAGIAHSLQWSTFFGPVPWQSALSLAVAVGGATLTFPLLLRALMKIPAAPQPRSALGRAWPWGFLAMGPCVTSWLLGWPFPSEIGLRAIFLLNVLFGGCALAILTRSFRRSGAAGRRKLKWVVYGFYLALLPMVAAAIVAAGNPSLTWVYEVAAAGAVAIPICGCIAFVRDDFLDIDRLITETTAYTGASLLLLVMLLQVIPSAARAVAGAMGIDDGAAQALVLAGLAVAAVPVRRWLSPFVQAAFFRQRGAAERALAGLRDELAALDEPGALLVRLGERLTAILEPEGCVLFARGERAFDPVFAVGPAAPAGFEAEGALVALLEDQSGPVDAARWRGWRRSGLLSGEAGAALDALQPALLVPVRGAERLAAFVCLGPKHSGELYAPSEVAWLAAVAERAASQLRRTTDAELLSRARELRERLARYVPGAVAEDVVRGDEMAPREREVSLFFVDIRGYTRFSETRSPEEIFAAVSLYTDAVSRLIGEQGGAVVEFHGDGLMAVFGAPRGLPAKESAALRAAREVARTVPRLPIAGAPLSVGVGIATGPAFVGNIRSADRVIWGALGNTTNLAARLQAMSRELAAAIVVDAPTFQRGGDAAAGFVDQGELPIRGRREAERVYALPLASA